MGWFSGADLGEGHARHTKGKEDKTKGREATRNSKESKKTTRTRIMDLILVCLLSLQIQRPVLGFVRVVGFMHTLYFT